MFHIMSARAWEKEAARYRFRSGGNDKDDRRGQMNRQPPRPAWAGFTLLEVLIAMSLLSLILLLLFTALHTGGRYWHASEARVAAADKRRLTRAFIRKQFEQAVPLRQISSSANRVLFHGAADSVLYVSYLPAHHAGAGMYVLRMLARDKQLLLQYLNLHEEIDMRHPPPLEAANARVLLEDITALTFAYYGRKDGDESPGWHARWTNGGALPELVRIELEHGAEGPWPVMIAPTRARASRDQPQLTIAAGKE